MTEREELQKRYNELEKSLDSKITIYNWCKGLIVFGSNLDTKANAKMKMLELEPIIEEQGKEFEEIEKQLSFSKRGESL
ncbi:hypothetical protein [Thermoactinomyces sp. DSM 45892]|uniref:hypothetical protein n=1 Tax=Thermoactinomyces sp. DSM 45892 TaxID=1882753 RepID=UPI0008958563|nr:hypothetical protein [Thermoactinomyces sp. DSM 45892]SDY86129.1 hypothetical protein SAMN05444416_10999 [Thermoactinomyces sp. DSM 45892]